MFICFVSVMIERSTEKRQDIIYKSVHTCIYTQIWIYEVCIYVDAQTYEYSAMN
jgi:hypothetical protein